MFGYVTIAPDALEPERRDRYRACYCGLCHTLKARHGQLGRATLSYDMTFLLLLLSSLYEPEETEGRERCAPHPFKPHAFACSAVSEYCADMNVALAYHKLLDDWRDDHSQAARWQAARLRAAYERVRASYPNQCAEIERRLNEISALEREGSPEPDAPANLTARMLGAVYRYREDLWADTLQRMGEALGRFIYLMDAWEDLPRDLKKGRYNPLKAYANREDYEAFIKDSLTLLISECADAFETLPTVQDMDILRNILYAGCWTRYRQNRLRRGQGSGELEPARTRGTRACGSLCRATHKEDGA